MVFVGDSTLSSVKGLSRSIAASRPDAVVFLGDMANERRGAPRPRHFKRWRASWAALADRVYTVPGNHDYSPAQGLDDWWLHAASRLGPNAQWFEQRAFVLNLPSVTVLGLDCGPSGRAVDAAQVLWMIERARERAPSWTVIALHSPLDAVSLHLNHPMRPDARDLVAELASAIGARLVVCGHEHLYARTGPIGPVIRAQIVAGGAGAGLYPVIREGLKASASRHHHVVVDFTAGVLTGRAIAPEGDVLDEWRWPL